MKIQEVMNKYPVTVGKDAPISDVADLLVKYNLTAVSVVDDDNKLLGISLKVIYYIKKYVLMCLIMLMY